MAKDPNENDYIEKLLWPLLLVGESVATLALGLQARQGFAKARAKIKPGSHISCSWECKRVWGNEPSHSQVNSHFGSSSPNGFPNFQRAIIGVKTHWIEKFLISLESSWNLDVWNGLASPIWTPKTQIMAKKRALGLQPRQGAWKGVVENPTLESHLHS